MSLATADLRKLLDRLDFAPADAIESEALECKAWTGDPAPKESQILAATLRDLRHSQGSLQQLARGPEVSSLYPVGAALARFAGTLPAQESLS